MANSWLTWFGLPQSAVYLVNTEYLLLFRLRTFQCCSGFVPCCRRLSCFSPCLIFALQVTARVGNPPPLKLQSFDGLVDHSCMEDQEKKGGILSKVSTCIFFLPQHEITMFWRINPPKPLRFGVHWQHGCFIW